MSNTFLESLPIDIYTKKYILLFMKTAKLFKNGQSQAVRLPREFRFDGSSVFVQRFGDFVMLMPMTTNPWKSMFDAAEQFSSDFMSTRDPGIESTRESFD